MFNFLRIVNPVSNSCYYDSQEEYSNNAVCNLSPPPLRKNL